MTTLRALECLVAVVDEGSVTAAAAALHMSQPALSHQIAALERELGTPVVERLGRGVRVTAAGRAAAGEGVPPCVPRPRLSGLDDESARARQAASASRALKR
jgi:DNA-binding transcriptional ArsR family regulator